jgi:hypothetical protein
LIIDNYQLFSSAPEPRSPPTPHAPNLKKCGEIYTVFVHQTELYSPLISDILNGINKRIATVIN